MDKVTPDNTCASWAGNAAASGSADSSAQSEFAKTIDQEAQRSSDAGHTPVSTGPTALAARDPKNERHLPPSSSQKTNGGSQVQGGGTRTSTVDRQMGGVLNNPHLSENEKVAELKKAIADLPDSEKKDLYERLKDRKSHDPLAQQFHYRLSHHPYKAGGVSTTDQVLNALKPAGSKSQAPTQDSRSAAPGKGASPSVTDAKTADARARDPILGQDATGLKPGEPISAKLTTKEDITNPQAEMTFDFSKQITKDQAAAILFQRGKVPDGATLTQGKGNQWTVQYRNNIYAKQDVVTHMNSHTESVLTRSKLPGEMFYPEPDVTFSWVGGAKAFSTTKVEPPRRDLKNDMGFGISKRYPLDEGQSPHMNLRRLVQPGPGYEVVFDKPKTADRFPQPEQ
jgi:hypothetical protein